MMYLLFSSEALLLRMLEVWACSAREKAGPELGQSSPSPGLLGLHPGGHPRLL